MAGCSASLSLEEAPELPSSSCWFCLVFFRNTPLLAQARKIKRLAAQHSSQRSRGISWTVLDTSSSVGTAVLCSSCVSCFQWSSECPNCCSTISFNCLTVELTASCSISHDKQAGSRRLVYPLEEQGPRYAFCDVRQVRLAVGPCDRTLDVPFHGSCHFLLVYLLAEPLVHQSPSSASR